MPGLLTEYALRLSLDPAELAHFRGSAEAARAAMTCAGLSEAEQVLMLGGDQRRICDALAADARTLHASTEVMEMPPGEPDETPPGEEPGPEPMEMPPEAMEMHPTALDPRSLVRR